MRVAFVTQFDPTDVRKWSGIVYYMMRSLAESGITVEPIGPLAEPRILGKWFLAKHAAYKWLEQNYDRFREPAVLKNYARQISARLATMKVDAVLSPSSVTIANLECPQPKLFWTDATFAAMVGSHYIKEMSAETLRHGLEMERRALARCRYAVFSSEWAARSARALGAPPEKVHVIELGANLDAPPSDQGVRALVARRVADLSGECRLLFVGVDWARKGGPVAIALARELNARNIRTTLTVVGCQPPAEDLAGAEHFVRVEGFISKRTPEGRKRLDDLFGQAHFLMLPSRDEAFGLVLGEANAFGVPCLACAVGGIVTIVRPGVNGYTFCVSAGAAEWADRIAPMIVDPALYEKMAMSSREQFLTRLNWKTAIRRLRVLLDRAVADPKGELAESALNATLVDASNGK